MAKSVKVSIYCWNCGEEDEAMFFQCSPYNKNMGESCCPACGIRGYALWQYLLELPDRQSRRGIPRL